jgi:CDP-diacylglycerol--serine O-phosphatidyltransferase
MIPPSRHKPFAMIREFHLADWFTLANAVCGTGAMFSMMSYLQSNQVMHVYLACALVLAALVFDVLDGRIARWRQQSSMLGRELDSLADVISFGVAPALIAYGCGMQGFFDRIVLAYFVACGVSRLARYNVTAEALSNGEGKVKYFEGTPIPTSLVLVLGDVRCSHSRRLARSAVVRQAQHRWLQLAPAGADVCVVRLLDG